jgi:hypothetical protein
VRKGIYYVDNGSLLIELARLRYRGERYEKWDINYYYITTQKFMTTERGVKLYPNKLKHWMKYDESDATGSPYRNSPTR